MTDMKWNKIVPIRDICICLLGEEISRILKV